MSHEPSEEAIEAAFGLHWVEARHGDFRAETPFGSYNVEYHDISGSWRWGYHFAEYYDEDSFECDDAEAGKRAAQEHWLGRIGGSKRLSAAYAIDEPRIRAEERERLAREQDENAEECQRRGIDPDLNLGIADWLRSRPKDNLDDH